MSKVRVAQWSRPNRMWFVETPQGNLIIRGWDEAMFLAQLLADPHEYLRRAQEIAWHQGRTAQMINNLRRSHDGSRMPAARPNPYRKEDQ